MEKIYVTKEGFDKLNARLRELLDVIQPKVIEELKEARAQGDLSENADYDAARKRQAEVDAEIKNLQLKIENAEIINDKGSTSTVNLGNYVLLKFSFNGKEEEYQIVGSTESNPNEFKISNECALAKAIIGHKIGDVVAVKANTPYEVTILSCSAKSKKN